MKRIAESHATSPKCRTIKASRLPVVTALLFGIVIGAQAQSLSRVLVGGPLLVESGANFVSCNIWNYGDTSFTVNDFHLRDNDGNNVENTNNCGGGLTRNNGCSITVVGAAAFKGQMLTCNVVVTSPGTGQPPQISGTLDARNQNGSNLLYVIPLSAP